jgi:polysaccharide pyruvyl transferase WcaK-like protein
MKGLGLDVTHDSVYPDIVFSLPASPATPRPDDAPAITVGVGVMAYYGWRGHGEEGQRIYLTYLEKITEFIAWVLDRNCGVRLITGDLMDAPAVQHVRDAVARKRPDLAGHRLVAVPIHSFRDVESEINLTDVVVATRFHNVVCAILRNKPVVSIGYAQKNDVLMVDMGLGRFCQQIEHLDVSRLIAQFEQLVAEREAVKNSLAKKCVDYRRRLDDQFNCLLNPPGTTVHALPSKPRLGPILDRGDG